MSEGRKKPRPLGGNEPDGSIWCGLCEWKGKGKTIEEVEFRLDKHLREAHGAVPLYREREDGKVVRLP